MDREAKTAYMKEYLKKYRLKNREKILDQMLEYGRKWREENREKLKEDGARYYHANKESRLEYQKRYRKTEREKYKARELLASAVRRGELIRQPCWCGAVGEAHHEDYDKPYQVTWLCRKHHAERHRKHENHGRPRG